MIKKKDIREWCKALRSGEYNQGRGQLQSSDGYCCMGVACVVFIPKSRLRTEFKGTLYGGFPNNQPYSPKWLENIDETFRLLTETSLVTLNDREVLTFDEIADCLEAVYIHEVLND